MLCFCFFLHHAEKRLNSAIYRFLTRNGIDRYDPVRFLDYKLEVLQMLLYCLPRFDPEQETEFLKYAKHYVRDAVLPHDGRSRFLCQPCGVSARAADWRDL